MDQTLSVQSTSKGSVIGTHGGANAAGNINTDMNIEAGGLRWCDNNDREDVGDVNIDVDIDAASTKDCGAANAAEGKNGAQSGDVVAVSYEENIVLFDAVTYERVAVLQTDGWNSGRIYIDEINSRLFATIKKHELGCGTHFISIWDLNTREVVKRIGESTANFGECFDVSDDGTKLVAALAMPPRVVIIDITTGEQLVSTRGNLGYKLGIPTVLCFTPGAGFFICGSVNRSIEVFDACSGNAVSCFNSRIGVRSIMSNRDGALCFVGAHDGLYAYEIVIAKLVWSVDMRAVYDFCFGCDSTEIIVAREGGTVEARDIITGMVRKQIKLDEDMCRMSFNHRTNCLVGHLSGRLCSVDMGTGEVTVIDAKWNDFTHLICCSRYPTILM
jgi:WD40 repeat protein